VISFVGLPGSGKSTVGRHLARRLQLPFLDSDHEIEQRVGCTVRQFFEREGEQRFRDIEEEVVEALTRERDGVLSTGGGVVLRPANRKHLHGRTTVFYLSAQPEDLGRRLRHDTSRPLLQVADPLARLRELHAQRDPLYRETAHYVLDTARQSVPTLVNMIAMQLELSGPGPLR
jgi:shikimate kinase